MGSVGAEAGASDGEPTPLSGILQQCSLLGDNDLLSELRPQARQLDACMVQLAAELGILHSQFTRLAPATEQKNLPAFRRPAVGRLREQKASGGGAGLQVGSGVQPVGGTHPTGGVSRFGGALNRYATFPLNRHHGPTNLAPWLATGYREPGSAGRPSRRPQMTKWRPQSDYRQKIALLWIRSRSLKLVPDRRFADRDASGQATPSQIPQLKTELTFQMGRGLQSHARTRSCVGVGAGGGGEGHSRNVYREYGLLCRLRSATPPSRHHSRCHLGGGVGELG